MPRNETAKALCVSIHDVAPQTWPHCRRLLDTIAEVADIPVTLLVVPHYHGQVAPNASIYEAALGRRLARGDELALHGYRHLDDGPPPRAPMGYFLRRIYTRGEGEFAALDAGEARRRIELGMAWFAERGWPLHGFVAPAWLIGAGTWQALDGLPFSYTTTLREFHVLRQQKRGQKPRRPVLSLPSPSLVYAARNAASLAFSRCRNAWLLRSLHDAPLVRLGLHPADARHPELLADCRRLLERLLEDREAATKASFAACFSESAARFLSRQE